MTRKAVERRKFLIISASLFILICIMIFSFTLKTDAKDNPGSTPEKYYKSILIESGDTLWSIAEENKPDDTISTQQYIKDLKVMNNITSDKIHAGNYLTIYYYN